MRKKPITSFAQNSDRALRGGRTSFKTRRGNAQNVRLAQGEYPLPPGSYIACYNLRYTLKRSSLFRASSYGGAFFCADGWAEPGGGSAAGGSFRRRKTAVSRHERLLPRRAPNMVDNRIRSVVLLYVNKILPNKRYTVWKTVGN